VSVQREVAVLRVLSHPGIARIASSFRCREGVYLVLEYAASGGDLHSLLRKNGSLDHDATCFVTGEVMPHVL
jgi:serine/threonine protein kinase